MLQFKDFFNELSKSHFLNKSDNDVVFYELAKKLTACFGLCRINIWLFSENEEIIECVGNYSLQGDKFSKGEVIQKSACPVYFEHLLSDEILSIDDVSSDERIAELRDSYCAEHTIKSMMDVPIRIGGKLVGVVCYEDTKKTRRWTLDEEYFAIAVNQIIAMAIEAQKRRVVQKKLERALAEKERLMHEMHHRIKNNLSLLVSLLRIQSRESESKEVKEALEDFQNRIFSISKIHEQLYRSNNFQDISLDMFLRELTSEYKNMHPEIQYHLDVERCNVSTEKIVSIGLICSEVISNAIKYAFLSKSSDYEKVIRILLREVDRKLLLTIGDNGSGFKTTIPFNKSSLGVYLIKDLSEEIGAKCTTESSANGVIYHFEIS
jgi:two-component sensor histidine kinase